jgi:DNA-binding transcriptional regulator YdaS (Cro superfamily)
MKSPLERAVIEAGGQTALARLIGARQQDIWYWLNRRDGRASAEFVIAIESATGVSRHELRPDIYPEEGRDQQVA